MRTLKEIAKIVGDMVMNDHVMDLVEDWELINGDDLYYVDDETGDELGKEEIKAYKNGEYPYDVSGYPVDIYQRFIIEDAGADYLMRHTDEIVYYSEKLEMYIWCLDDFGTPWEAVKREFREESGPGLKEFWESRGCRSED